MSLGSEDRIARTTPDALTNAVNNLADQGFIVVVAAGNNGADACDYSPSRAAKAITVGASTATDARAGFSNNGACVDIFAPGTGIRSLDYSNAAGSMVMQGTSMAAPHVAGAAAIAWAENSTAGQATIQSQVVDYAVTGVISSAGTGSPNRLLSVANLWESAAGTTLPVRLADTRNTPYDRTIDGISQGVGAVGPGQTLRVPVLGRAGVPATGVGAVVVNVTATSPSSIGFLTVFPTGETRPGTSSLNFTAGQTVANSVIARVGADGSISIFNHSGSTHVIVDISGWFLE